MNPLDPALLDLAYAQALPGRERPQERSPADADASPAPALQAAADGFAPVGLALFRSSNHRTHQRPIVAHYLVPNQ